MIPLLLLLLLQAPPADITVTGKRLLEAHAACVQGGCTPLRDAQASIALAEAQFREGDYMATRRLLSAAISRNRDHAATDPKPVAALYEALATVAAHEGDQAIYRRAVAGQVRTLRDHLPASDAAVRTAAPALGDMWTKLRNYRQANAAYRAAEQDATRAGDDATALLLAVKRVWLVLSNGQSGEATRMLDAIAARPAAANPRLQAALRVMRFRIAARDAGDTEITRLAGAIGQAQGHVPALLWAPPLPSDAISAANADARKFGTVDAVAVRASDLDAIQWIDVGYWIRPDGRTAEVELLRGSRSHAWSGAMLTGIAGRRYSPFDRSGAATGGVEDAGIYRVERITRRSTYVTPGKSLIRRRVAADGFEILDLTSAADATG